jgi:hypothetical protein
MMQSCLIAELNCNMWNSNLQKVFLFKKEVHSVGGILKPVALGPAAELAKNRLDSGQCLRTEVGTYIPSLP